jgi:thiaminase/transcriptional activator TenA
MMGQRLGQDFGSAIFARWRAESTRDWQAFTHHSFVEGLGDGTLPRAAFLHYLVQDYVFLIHFSRAWALAVVKAESLAEMRAAARAVDGLVNHEMQLHVEVCAREGLSEHALFAAEEELENLAYTRFVIDAGVSGDFLDLMAALAPCVLGYGEIGARLGASASAANPYGEWIAAYASDEYQALCHSVGELIDVAVAARLGSAPTENPRWPALLRKFRTATRLEAGFWDMGLRGGR